MRRQLLHVEQLQTVMEEDLLHGAKAEVREVLMVDGVELVLFDEPQQVGEFHRDHARGSEQLPHPTDEVIDVGNVRQHVVAEYQFA